MRDLYELYYNTLHVLLTAPYPSYHAASFKGLLGDYGFMNSDV